MTDDTNLEFEGRGFTDTELKAIPSLERVVMLALWDTGVTDSGFAELKRAESLVEVSIRSDLLSGFALDVLSTLPSLRSLQIHHGPLIADQGLKSLSNCRELRELYLKETAISDKGVMQIGEAPNLWSLVLDDTKLSDEGCAALVRMPKLSLLSLNRTKVTGSALAGIRDNDHLGIYLDGTPATDDAVAALTQRLSKLKRIGLGDTHVGDRSARALAGLQLLNEVRLSNTRITDLGLNAFKGHPFLDVIYVKHCGVSSAAVNALKQASPRRLRVYGP